MNDQNLTTDAIVAVVSPVSNSGSLYSALTHKCNVKRRDVNASRDALNEIDYGNTIDWANIYIDLPCRLEIVRANPIEFKPTGERMKPKTILYVDASTPLKPEDRVYMLDNRTTGLPKQQEFVVQGALPAMNMIRQPRHHLEYRLALP